MKGGYGVSCHFKQYFSYIVADQYEGDLCACYYKFV